MPGELADETVRAAVVTPVTSGLVGLLGPVKFDPCPEIESEALARLVGWKMTLKELALRMRCSRCGKKAAEVVAAAGPRRRGITENPY